MSNAATPSNTASRTSLKVWTDGNAGPYIMADVALLEAIKALLEQHRIPHWVDEESVQLEGKPAIVVINLGLKVDPVLVQSLLDTLP